MKEEFKNRWLEFLIYLVIAIFAIIRSFNESNTVDERISSAFLAGACVWGICDFFGRHTAKATEKLINKKKSNNNDKL